MSRSNIGIALLAFAFAALGFALGQFYEDRREKPGWEPPPPPPEYTAHASFEVEDPFEGPIVAPPTASAGSLDEILADKNDLRRASRLSARLLTLGVDQTPEVAALLEQGAVVSAIDIGLLTRFWATYDPDKATSWAFHKSPRGSRIVAMASALKPLAEVDVEVAAALVNAGAFAPGLDTTELERVLIRAWFETGQAGIETYMQNIGDSFQRQRALVTFFRSAIDRDGPTAVGQWTEALPDEDSNFKLQAFRQLAIVLTQRDPAYGLAWCEAHCDGRYGTNLRMLVAQNYVTHDPQAALEWLSGAGEGEERDRAVRGALGVWARTDRNAVLRWVEGIGVDGIEPWLEPGRPIIAGLYLATDPLLGIAWAESIADPEQREFTLKNLVEAWRRNDPEAAQAWVDQSSEPSPASE